MKLPYFITTQYLNFSSSIFFCITENESPHVQPMSKILKYLHTLLPCRSHFPFRTSITAQRQNQIVFFLCSLLPGLGSCLANKSVQLVSNICMMNFTYFIVIIQIMGKEVQCTNAVYPSLKFNLS